MTPAGHHSEKAFQDKDMNFTNYGHIALGGEQEDKLFQCEIHQKAMSALRCTVAYALALLIKFRVLHISFVV